MSNPPQANWKDPEYRQQVLLNTPWRLLIETCPAISDTLSESGLPNCFLKWTNGDKLAFRYLYEHSGDPVGVAKAFGINMRLRENAISNVREDAAYVTKIFPELQKILAKFEPDIRRRWQKKSWNMRKDLMSKAWINLPESHRPDLQALRTLPTLPKGKERERCDFIFPHMNYEDLGTGKTFLRLLNARGRNQPSRFVLFDLDSVQTGLRSKALPFEFYPLAIDLGCDVESQQYGLISPRSDEDVLAIAEGRKMALSEGMLVLEIQARILVFLRDCCRLIMHDKIDKIDDDTMPVQPEPEPLPAHDQQSNGIVWAALERPYMLPQGLVDVQGMLSQAKAALEEARERVFALREDPFYFSTSVTDAMEHSWDNLKDSLGRQHSNTKQPRKVVLAKMVKKLLLDALLSFFEWELMVFLLEQVVREEPGDEYLKARPELQPCDDYFLLLMKVRFLIDDTMLRRFTARLLEALVTNPSGRGRFVRRTTAEEPLIRPTSKPPPKPLEWLILQGVAHLANENHNVANLSIDDLLIEIQRLVATETRSKELLSPLAVETMGRAGLLADLRSQLTNFRPSAFMPFFGPGFEIAEGGSRDASVCDMKQEVAGFLERTDAMIVHQVLGYILESEKSLSKLGEDADRVVGKVPNRGRRKMTKELTEALQQAEANLDKFWEGFDQTIGDFDEDLRQRIINITSPRQFVCTPDWVEPVPKAPPGKGKAPLGVGQPEALLPFGQLSLGPGHEVGVPETTETVEKREKVKTRGVADPSKAEEAPVEQEEANGPPAKPIFKLRKQAMKVVRVLFHHAHEKDLPGHVDWSDFVSTMQLIGFESVALYGSATKFTPTGEQAQGLLSTESIIIHAPHPVPKVDFWIARRHGRRLTMTYGLDASSFEES